jgi:hypothetical protein
MISVFLGAMRIWWPQLLIGTVIASLAAFSWLQTSRLKSAQETLAQIEATANAAQEQTNANLKRIQEAVPLMVDQAQTNAVRNYLARHRPPMPDPAGCNVSVGLRPQGGDGQAPSAPDTDDTSGERLPLMDAEFIKACARDAGRLMLWIELCKLNPLTCQVVE